MKEQTTKQNIKNRIKELNIYLKFINENLKETEKRIKRLKEVLK